MYSPEELKERKDILGRVDWDLTPQEAFEKYQCMSPETWKNRNLEDAYFFEIYVLRGQDPKVVLMKKTMKDSEELAEVPVPRDLVMASLPRKDDGGIPFGHYPLDEPVREWIQAELDY